ncbi:hypothetical protein V7S43_016934 [Phytophthora oleae]|uniref:Elicitin n=1 Tax=Phytophthora oleae TaxID=2107226 RepID=A0ABD3EXN7_9STRA
MKISALLMPLTVRAAVCTTNDLTTISGIFLSVTPTNCLDITTIADSSSYCSNPKCLEFAFDVVDKLPDCSISDVNIKEFIEDAIESCRNIPSSVLPSSIIVTTSPIVAVAGLLAVA